MKTDYDNAYFPDNVYGHVVALLQRQLGREQVQGVHLDLGCGYGRIAEPLVQATGLDYLGLDLNPDGVQSLRDRGFDADVLDFRAQAQVLVDKIRAALRGRTLRSMSMMDILEHIAEPSDLLLAIRALLLEFGAVFCISVPNIAHRDVGFKLALGRFDVRATGLLDYTHVHGFNEEQFLAFLGEHGLRPVERNDVCLEASDQAFPATHAALSGTTLLGAHLRELRNGVDRTATVNQFVAACLPGPLGKLAHLEVELALEQRRPFLSVVTRTQGRRPAGLRDVLVSLAAQSCDDFEVIVVGHKLSHAAQLLVERLIDDVPESLRSRIRLHRVHHGNRTAPLNEGFEQATGDYVAILDDDDVPMAHWVETFKALAVKSPGCVLRAVAVKQEHDEVSTKFAEIAVPRSTSSFIKEYPSAFNWLDHLRVNQTPPIALAFPRSAFADLKIRFDESLTTTEDWDFLMRTAAVCGVVSSPAITCVYRWWKGSESSRSVHSQEEWVANHHRIFAKLDSGPLLFPAGATQEIRALLDRADKLSHLLVELNARLTSQGAAPVALDLVPADAGPRTELLALLDSRSWRITAPLRTGKRILKGLPHEPLNVGEMSASQVAEAIRNIRASSSWRITAVLRRLFAR